MIKSNTTVQEPITLSPELVEEFLSDLSQHGRTKGTVRVYRSYLKKLCGFLPEEKPISFGDLDDVREYMLAAGVAPRTAKKVIRVAKSFLGYCGQRELYQGPLEDVLIQTDTPAQDPILVSPDLIEEFLEDLSRRGRAEKTLRSYRAIFRRLSKFLPEDKPISFGDLDDVREYMLAAGVTPGTVEKTISVANNLLRYSVRRKVYQEPSEDVFTQSDTPEQDTVLLSPELIKEFLDYLAQRGRANSTLWSYRSHLRALYQALPEDKRLNNKTLSNARACMLAAGAAPSTVSRTASVAHGLMKFCASRKQCQEPQEEIAAQPDTPAPDVVSLSTELIEEFLNDLAQRGRTKKTLWTYRSHLHTLYQVLPEGKELNDEALSNARARMLDAGTAPSTVSGAISAAHGLLKFCASREQRQETQEVVVPQPDTPAPDAVSLDPTLIEEFLTDQAQRGRGKKILRGYSRKLWQLYKILPMGKQISFGTLDDAQERMLSAGMSPGVVKQTICVVIGLLKYCARRQEICKPIEQSALHELCEDLGEDEQLVYGVLDDVQECMLDAGADPSAVKQTISAAKLKYRGQCKQRQDALVNKILELRARADLEDDSAQAKLTRAEYLRLLTAARNLGKERAYLLVKVYAGMGLFPRELILLTVEAVEAGQLELPRGHTACVPSCLRQELLDYAQANDIFHGPIFMPRTSCPGADSGEIRSLSAAARVAPKKCTSICLRGLYQETQESIRGGMEYLVDQAHGRLLDMEQANIGWWSEGTGTGPKNTQCDSGDPQERDTILLTPELIEEFLSDLSQHGRSKDTLSAYRSQLRRLYEDLPEGKELNDETLSDARERMLDAGMCLSAENKTTAAVKGLRQYCAQREPRQEALREAMSQPNTTAQDTITLSLPLIEEFLDDLSRRGRGERMLWAYRSHLRMLYNALPENKQVGYETLPEVRTRMLSAGIAPSTVDLIVSACNKLLKYCEKRVLYAGPLCPDLFEEFLDDLAQRGRAKETLRSYRSLFRKLCEFLPEGRQQLCLEDLNGVWERMMDAGMALHTVETAICVAKGLLRYCAQRELHQGPGEEGPSAVTQPNAHEQEPIPLTPALIEAFLADLSRRGRSEKTLRVYRNYFQKLCKFLPADERLCFADLPNVRERMLAAGVAPGTAKGTITAVNGLLKYCVRRQRADPQKGR